jgi:S-adenosylmethionine hydrolase
VFDDGGDAASVLEIAEAGIPSLVASKARSRDSRGNIVFDDFFGVVLKELPGAIVVTSLSFDDETCIGIVSEAAEGTFVSIFDDAARTVVEGGELLAPSSACATLPCLVSAANRDHLAAS